MGLFTNVPAVATPSKASGLLSLNPMTATSVMIQRHEWSSVYTY